MSGSTADYIGTPDMPILLAEMPSRGHQCHQSQRVLIKIWSRHWGGYYDHHFCPDCSEAKVQEELLGILEGDRTFFTAPQNMLLLAVNGDIVGNVVDPHRTVHIGKLCDLVKQRRDEGGTIAMRITRGSVPISFWVVMVVFVTIIGVLIGLGLGRNQEGAKNAFLGLLGNLLSGFFQHFLVICYYY